MTPTIISGQTTSHQTFLTQSLNPWAKKAMHKMNVQHEDSIIVEPRDGRKKNFR